MFDLHTHSLLSDGALLPSELARRYEVKGYTTIAITDHVDASNIKRVVSEIVEFTRRWPSDRIRVIPGIELTHIPLEQFTSLIKYARKKGIKIIIAHGQSPVEPVTKGTNKKALESNIDILAHPGKISEEEVKLAKKKGIFLEITSRRGHKLTNRLVAKLALRFGAKLVLNSDSHCPEDILAPPELIDNAKAIGLNRLEIRKIYHEVQKFLDRI